MREPLKILIVEDNQSDADLLCRELKKSGLDFVHNIVQTRKGYEQALGSYNPDLILSDYSLPSFDAVTAFQIKQINHVLTPFIIISGVIGEENAVELIKSGVTDYVSKANLFTLPTKICRAIDDAQLRQEKLVIAEELKRLNIELLDLNEELETRVVNRTLALHESENRFRSMMETIPQMAWTSNVNGKVDYYNQRWYDYTGLDSASKNMQAFEVVIHPDDLELGLTSFSSILHGKDGGEFQMRIKRYDGIFRWHLVRLMPVKAEKSDIQLWVGTATDIQELRLLQQYKDDFISIASHEIKTPITSLKGSLQMLDKIKANAPSELSFKLIAQASKSLARVNILIEDLLNASMANQGQLNISRQQFNIFDLITCCVGELDLAAHTIVIDGERNIDVVADTIRIEQVLVNFITNAIKYAPDAKEILINIKKIDGYVKVCVVDRGPGIPAEKIRYLFDRYYQVSNASSLYTGLGLGLYICEEIIKKHKGQIGAKSELNNGSNFWFTLPLADHIQDVIKIGL
ncbi:ATP-binding protein [Pedobacter sp. JCM 36344]|uniref:hybrid sensor histidine kinase/response regulator n=1 Tax=Pedobacter sp. JCM 36344 TaxID=3374280 RepID=UPI00397E29B0